MAQLMTDEQRLKALEEYNPKDHLISVGKNKDGTAVLYYPAAWRLYELRLRHPHFTLEAEIVHMEEGTVIIKAIGYDGLDYASSNLKGTALKQGKLFELDKVETKAKSRVARDIGIGTEYALDMTGDETDATHDEPKTMRIVAQTTTDQDGMLPPASNGQAEPDIVIDNLKAKISKVQQRAFDSGIKTKGEWAKFRKEYAQVESNEELTVAGLAKMDGELTKREKMPKTA